MNKADFVRTLPKMYRGTHVQPPEGRDRCAATRVAIEAEEPLPVTLDGEQPGTTPIVFRVVPKALRLRVPG